MPSSERLAGSAALDTKQIAPWRAARDASDCSSATLPISPGPAANNVGDVVDTTCRSRPLGATGQVASLPATRPPVVTSLRVQSSDPKGTGSSRCADFPEVSRRWRPTRLRSKQSRSGRRTAINRMFAQ